MSEQQKILEMIENGQISAVEGMELLEALNNTNTTNELTTKEFKTNYKFLKVKVTSDNNTVNVNVNIPIRLLTTLGEIATKITTLIPKEARSEMENKGIDITTIEFSKIIEEILNGTVDDPTIVDVEVKDEKNDTIKVKIYVE